MTPLKLVEAAKMRGSPKPNARQAFDENIADAQTLVQLARSLVNQRVYRMRAEKRAKLGDALGRP